MAAANTEDGVSDDLNYETWAPTAKTTLVEKGLWDVVENGVPQDPTKDPELAATIKVADLAFWRNRVMRDIKALKIMQASLPDSAFRKTITSASAKELWDSLERGNEEAKLRRLENQFEELSMCEKESIVSYLARVSGIVEELRGLNNEKSDYEVVKKVLGSISGPYKEAAPVIEELMDLKKMNLDSLAEFFRRYDAMPDEYVYRMMKQEAESGGGKWCDVCKKEGHNREECYSIPKEGDWTIQPDFGIEHEDEIAVDYVMLAKLELGAFTYDEDTWMIYGHATCNMTPHEKLFTSLDRTQKPKVGLVDGTVIVAEGRGDVKVMMKDGKKKTIRDVLFVPRGINRNVLSVPLMTSRGCSFKPGERGECIVRDKSGAVFGDTTWDERGLSIRMQVIQANLST
ncbi:hypothetical protein Bca101_083466 [Brassica carinata]